eukprot:gene5594-6284_t
MERLSKKKYSFAGQESSFQRVLKIQQYLSERRCKADCVLIIVGVDSKFCNGSRNLLEKILPGFEEAAPAYYDTTSDEFAEEAMDDIVICIKKDSTEIYCNPQNYDCLMSYSACWKNIVVHCLDKTQYENHEDLTEDLKILSFVKMMENCSVVAVPYYYNVEKEYQTEDFDPMFIEQWPLIQAYAVEGIGSGGFFTMKHEVIDATELLSEALCSFDPLSLELLLTKQVKQFDKQWETLVKTMDVIGSQNLPSLTEESIVEPLQTYYQHATGEHNASTISEPSVRFGVSTGRQSEKAELKKPLGKSGIDQTHAYHMVCYGRDSKGILSCKRTYFFENTDKDTLAEVRLLQTCYLLSVEAVDTAIKGYCNGGSVANCRDLAVKSLINSAKKMKSAFIPNEHDVEVIFFSRDQFGRVNCLENGTTKTFEVVIHNIPSMKFKGASLGSVAFADTFITSSINFKDQQASKDTECLLLTRGVQRFASWLTEHSESSEAQIEDEKKQFGNLLIDHASCMLVCGDWPAFDTKEVSLWCFENGLSISHARFGRIRIPLQSVSSWETFDNDSTTSATLIIIHPNSDLLNSLPFSIAKDARIMLAFQSRSKAHVAFYDRAFHIWKEQRPGYASLNTIQVLSKELRYIYNIIEEVHKLPDQKETALARLFRLTPNLKRFFKHFELSSAAFPSLTKDDFRRFTSDGFDFQTEQEVSLDDSEFLLTVITGLPGSDSENLCKALTSLARESSRWITMKVPGDIREAFNIKGFQDQLSMTYRNLTQQKGRPQASSRKRRRLILLIQGFINIKDVITAIEEHPDPVIRSKLIIGSVNCCINPGNLFLFGSTFMPLALEQCRSGFVNTVIFTGCVEQDKASILASAQRLIRQCNHGASFIIVKGGEVTRTPDVETILSETVFSEINAIKSRFIYNIKRTEDGENIVKQITIPFYQRVDRNRFLSCLKELKGQLSIDNLFDDAVLFMQGKIGFIDHSDVYDFKWHKINGLQSLVAADQTLSPRPPSSKKNIQQQQPQQQQQESQSSKYFITFFGIGIKESKLKDVMRDWEKQEKQMVRRKDITSNKLKEIESCHKLDPLPEGWFFDGSQYAFHFDLSEKDEPFCFIEELEDNVRMRGSYNVTYHGRNVGGVGTVRKMKLDVSKPGGSKIISKSYSGMGTFAFNSENQGMYAICFGREKGTAAEFVRIQMHYEESFLDEEEQQRREEQLEKEEREREEREEMKNEKGKKKKASKGKKEAEGKHEQEDDMDNKGKQKYEKEDKQDISEQENKKREKRFRILSKTTNRRVLWWAFFQVLVLAATAFWQMRHLTKFFILKKIV